MYESPYFCNLDVAGKEPRVCHYSARTDDKIRVQQLITSEDKDEAEYGPGKIQGDQEECLRASDHCYAFWREDTHPNNTGGVIYIAQGSFNLH